MGTGGENAATLNYPEDFISFLNKQKNNAAGCIDYSASAVEKEIALINQSLDTIPVDSYFIDWIENSQVNTTDDSDGPGYKQLLKFKPIIDYNEVKVTVLEPTGGKGHFNNPALAQGQTATFHAGDLLDLSAVAEDAANDRVMGYEVSTDGGVHFDTVTSETTLFLESFKSYIIRPVIAGNDNRIEIQFADSEAMRNLEIVDVISAAELFDNDQLRGRTILDVNPEEKTVEKKMQPVVGKDYSVKIRVTGKPAENGYVYRPVVTDALTGSSYNTQIYYLNARNRKEDNILRVSVEKVKESELQTWNISGDIASAIAPIRSNGLELKNLPVVNTTVMMGNGQNRDGAVLIASAQTDETGAYTIMDVTARAGDRIPLLLSNGLTNGQVTELVLPVSSAGNGKNTANVGRSLIGYPTGIPKVIDITYSYDKLANNQSNDNTQNSVNIYDDTFHITAYAETVGREISHAVFTVYTPQGVRTEYSAYPNDGDAESLPLPYQKWRTSCIRVIGFQYGWWIKKRRSLTSVGRAAPVPPISNIPMWIPVWYSTPRMC